MSVRLARNRRSASPERAFILAGIRSGWSLSLRVVPRGIRGCGLGTRRTLREGQGDVPGRTSLHPCYAHRRGSWCWLPLAPGFHQNPSMIRRIPRPPGSWSLSPCSGGLPGLPPHGDPWPGRFRLTRGCATAGLSMTNTYAFILSHIIPFWSPKATCRRVRAAAGEGGGHRRARAGGPAAVRAVRW
jgi:hypothetical protein